VIRFAEESALFFEKMVISQKGDWLNE